MLILVGFIVAAVIFILVRQVQAIRKTGYLKNARLIANTKIVDISSDVKNTQQQWKSNLGESAVLSAGSTGLSLHDIYATASNHEAVLNVIEQRFPHAIGGATPMEWFAKVETLIKNDSLNTSTFAVANSQPILEKRW